MTSDRLPSQRLERLGALARLGAKTGVSLLTKRDPHQLAVHTVEVLGQLRGLATKVGQTLSSVDGLLPESLGDVYKLELARLRNQTATTPAATVKALLESELGASPSELFRSFDPEPFASASIGQVHRATTHDGRVVAVKVQHPGVAAAVEHDLSSMHLLERLVSTLVPKAFDPERVFLEVAARFREELDYRHEALHQRRFARIHAQDPSVIVPTVLDELSTGRILTTEYVDGSALPERAELGTNQQIELSSILWRFVFRSILVGAAFNADPHPGNFLALPEGRIAFLDFGCIQRLEPGRLELARHIHEAAIERDDAGFSERLREMLGLKGGPYEDFILDYTRFAYRPLFESPFAITQNYARELVSRASQGKTKLLRRDSGIVAFPPGLALMNRLQFGFYSLLARWGATVDYAGIQQRLLTEPLFID